jgi:hypothetical protein
MDPNDMPAGAGRRRRNRAILLGIAGIVLVGIALPPLWSRAEQPQSRYDTYAQARAAGALDRGLLPRRLPPSAREIREKHFADADHHWARFGFDAADLERMVAGLPRLSPAEVKRLRMPSPGWVPWWRLNPGTVDSKQAAHLRFYRAEDGYLAVDPRTSVAYFWTE